MRPSSAARYSKSNSRDSPSTSGHVRQLYFAGACSGWDEAIEARALTIVEFAREHGRVTMADAIALTGGDCNTLKQHFRALVERGQLSRHGAGRGAWYGPR